MNLIKLIKYGAYRNCDEIEEEYKFIEYRFKSVSSIEHNYLEVATGGVLKKAVLKNFAIFSGKQLCWGLFLILKRDSNTGVFLCILQIFIYFEICEMLLLIILLH